MVSAPRGISASLQKMYESAGNDKDFFNALAPNPDSKAKKLNYLNFIKFFEVAFKDSDWKKEHSDMTSNLVHLADSLLHSNLITKNQKNRIQAVFEENLKTNLFDCLIHGIDEGHLPAYKKEHDVENYEVEIRHLVEEFEIPFLHGDKGHVEKVLNDDLITKMKNNSLNPEEAHLFIQHLTPFLKDGLDLSDFFNETDILEKALKFIISKNSTGKREFIELIELLPSGIKQLDLSGLNHFNLDLIAKFADLEKLTLRDAKNLNDISKLKRFENLSELDLTNCSKLKTIEALRALPLTKINFTGCDSISEEAFRSVVKDILRYNDTKITANGILTQIVTEEIAKIPGKSTNLTLVKN